MCIRDRFRVLFKRFFCHSKGLPEPSCPAEQVHKERLIRPCPGCQAVTLLPRPPQEICSTPPAYPGRHIVSCIVAGPGGVEGLSLIHI